MCGAARAGSRARAAAARTAAIGLALALALPGARLAAAAPAAAPPAGAQPAAAAVAPPAASGAIAVRVMPPPAGCAPIEPPIVFLPALGFTGASFTAVARRTTVCRARVLVDLPGTGASPATPQIHAQAVMADLLRLVRRWDGVVVVGHSLGGALAVRLAARAPARVRGVVLVDAAVAPFPLSWWQRAVLHPWLWIPWLHLIGAERSVRYALRRLHETPTPAASESVHILARELSSARSRAVLLQYYRAFLQPRALRRTERDLGRIHVPVLVLWGVHDHVVPPRTAGEIRDALPRSTPVTTRWFTTGHLLPIEQPQAMADAISAFARLLQPPARARSGARAR